MSYSEAKFEREAKTVPKNWLIKVQNRRGNCVTYSLFYMGEAQ